MRAAFCGVLLWAGVAWGDNIVPGPGQAGYDGALEAKADGIDLQLHTFMTPPLGWGLEAYIPDPAARAEIDAFFASGEDDFIAFTGRHPYEVIDTYDEMGDLGMFGGVQAAGDAFRYAVLRDAGDPRADGARAALIAAMDGLHWYTAVTGEPGAIARGLQRITPQAGEPPVPGPVREILPLFDGQGNPQPADKTATWREDRSGELPFLIWQDDTSKDQFDGYVFALGAVYDVVAQDPSIPADAIDRLVEDARAIGLRLMQTIEVAPGVMSDLVLIDADGRPTRFHDLSAEEVLTGVVFEEAINGFNGWMALGAMRTLFHISGDERIGRFYRDLIERRDYLHAVELSLAVMYQGNLTNFSNVNMAFVAAYGVLRYESDPVIQPRIRALFYDELYAPGLPRDAQGLGQSFFDFMAVAFPGPSGSGSAREEGLQTLREAPAAPYWDRLVENCDAEEIAQLDCTGEDGTHIVLSDRPSRGGGLASVDPVPMRIRPPSNFEWRSDPHNPNGGGGTRLNPGGGFHAAYWMGRYLADDDQGLSPIARPLPEAVAPGADAGVELDAGIDAAPDVDGGPTAGGGGDGCSCRAGGGAQPAAALGLLWLILLAVVARPARRAATDEVPASPAREASWLRASVAFVWIATGVSVLHPEYRRIGAEALGDLGLPVWLMPVTCAAEVALGARMLLGGEARWLTWMQVALVTCFTAILAAREPMLLAHPFGVLSKNLPLLSIVVVTALLDREGWSARARWVLRAGMASIWITEGLFPKILFQQPMELAVVEHSGLVPFDPALFLGLMGAAQVLSGIAVLGLRGRALRVLLILQTVALVVLPLLVSAQDPLLWVHPFGPMIKNVPMIVGTWVLVRLCSSSE